MREAVAHLLAAYSRLADAIRNGTMGIEVALRYKQYDRIQGYVDRIKEAFDGCVSAADAVPDDPAEPGDGSEAEGV